MPLVRLEKVIVWFEGKVKHINQLMSCDTFQCFISNRVSYAYHIPAMQISLSDDCVNINRQPTRPKTVTKPRHSGPISPLPVNIQFSGLLIKNIEIVRLFNKCLYFSREMLTFPCSLQTCNRFPTNSYNLQRGSMVFNLCQKSQECYFPIFWQKQRQNGFTPDWTKKRGLTKSPFQRNTV